jgi:hypothetical protein
VSVNDPDDEETLRPFKRFALVNIVNIGHIGVVGGGIRANVRSNDAANAFFSRKRQPFVILQFRLGRFFSRKKDSARAGGRFVGVGDLRYCRAAPGNGATARRTNSAP